MRIKLRKKTGEWCWLVGVAVEGGSLRAILEMEGGEMRIDYLSQIGKDGNAYYNEPPEYAVESVANSDSYRNFYPKKETDGL